MPMVYKRIEKMCKLLLNFSQAPVASVEFTDLVACGYKEDNTFPTEGWQPYAPPQGADRHFWLRGSFRTPKAEPGYRYILNIYDNSLKGWNANNPQGLLYLNGKMVQGIDIHHRTVSLEPDQDYAMHLYLYTAHVKRPIHLSAQLFKQDVQTDALYYDILTPFEALSVLNENTSEYRDTLSALEQAVNLLDLRAPGSEAFRESVRQARDFLDREFYGKLCSAEGKPVVHCIGSTHIDVEWKWARKQTREKIQRSFATAKDLMDEYPEYLFTLSQPELYRYLKEEAPEKYEELKELVAQGRWEPEGAMWVECDCNLTGGESFVRQLLQGKKFFREEFGKDSKILFLPDVFGYSAALPQILRKSGVDYFVTSKISWNDTNTMPHDFFIWEGIDGTEIPTSFITSRKAQPDHATLKFCTYNSFVDAPYVLGTWDRFSDKEYTKNALMTYGYGDGGGGPTREMLEKQRRLAKGLPGIPVAKTNHLLPYLQETEKEFRENCEKLRRTPKWVGELYLEFHRGTYTSVAKNKRGNRKTELALQKCEALSYADLLSGGSYDADGLYAAWRKVLHNQFHDILPGSSIAEVYEGTDKDYAQLSAYCTDVTGGKLAALAGKINSPGGLLVYNALGFARNGMVQVGGKTVELSQSIPAFGWAVLAPEDAVSKVEINALTAETPHYRMTLDAAGRIASLFDKAAGREVFQSGKFGNELQVFEDRPYNYEAWELSDYYKSKMYVLDTPAQIEAVTDGSRSGWRITRKYMNSLITQNIWLYSESRRIDFETEADWHERDQVLKIAFPVDVLADRAAYEIQFGHVYRPTHSNTGWDQAKFEVCAHKWVDIAENGYGVSLLNDCKYGFNAEGSTLKLTALKCSPHPDPDVDKYADQGEHRFSYALLPHSGSLYQAGTIREAYSFNQPLAVIPIAPHAGTLPQNFSLVSCNAENVILETVKKAESNGDMIVRLYESFGSRAQATVTVADGFRKAYLCDLMENILQELPFDGNSMTLPVKNFEIVTLRFSR